jgi:sensor histidine kinase YesM
VGALSAPYRTLYGAMAAGCLVFLAVLLWIVNYMAERISKPLGNLSAALSDIGLKNLHLPERRYATEELAKLDEAFRAMLARLDQSINLEMQAYMRALQAQMNPHFLYNTLSVVIASSEAAGDARTASMCLKLTAILRYVADMRRESVRIADEVAHTRNYLDLMQERYEGLFHYEISVGEGAAEVALPRLTLQPLAENCFIHGFQNEPPWHIDIRAEAADGRWTLIVQDNGIGMTDAEIEALKARIQTYRADIAGSYRHLAQGGLGVVNTLLRLMLMYKLPVTYQIQHRPGGGLIIAIGGPITDDSRVDRRG